MAKSVVGGAAAASSGKSTGSCFSTSSFVGSSRTDALPELWSQQFGFT